MTNQAKLIAVAILAAVIVAALLVFVADPGEGGDPAQPNNQESPAPQAADPLIVDADQKRESVVSDPEPGTAATRQEISPTATTGSPPRARAGSTGTLSIQPPSTSSRPLRETGGSKPGMALLARHA